MFKAVIFDLDGTLLNTLDDLAASVNYALRKFSFPERSVSQVRAFIGNGVIKLMERAVPYKLDDELFDECFSAFKTHYLKHMRDTTRAYDGIDNLLENLKKSEIKTAVVSNKLHSGVVGLCDEFFKDGLTCAFGVSDESERKPSPINVFKALEEMGVQKDETIYVGDSEVDVQTAKNAGLKCIGITWGFRDKEELVESGADYIANTPNEVFEIVKGN